MMVYDVLIIGAGPCGLAVASRLHESTPSALFTDAEHARYWRKSNASPHTLEHEVRKSHRRQTQVQANRSPESRSSSKGPSIVVLDATADSWLSLWRSRFKALQISHLRSPLFFHCDPRDRDGLLAYSYGKDRVTELQEITNVVGKEVSKHHMKKNRKTKNCHCAQSVRHLKIDGRDQVDYFTPSSGLFEDYCENIVERYDLHDIIHKAEVTNISYDDIDIVTEKAKLFTVTTASKQTYLARTVVLATGPGRSPLLPAEFRNLSTSNTKGSICHIFDKTDTQCLDLPLHVTQRLGQGLPTSIAIIGGGLTSAQTVSMLLKQNPAITKIYLICRSKLKVKHFDVDLNWVSKLRNHAMSAFWSADSDQERFEMLKAARNGGSIPPAWDKILKKLVKTNKVEILEETLIDNDSSRWNDECNEWTLSLTRTRQEHDPPSFTSPITVSHLLIATSQPPDIAQLPYLTHLRTIHPIASINGLPQLSHDLKWTDDVPLFLTGTLAGLRLGPGAGNLAGARLGAERVAWGLEGVLGKGYQKSRVMNGSNDAEEGADVEGYTHGFANMFEALEFEVDEHSG